MLNYKCDNAKLRATIYYFYLIIYQSTAHKTTQEKRNNYGHKSLMIVPPLKAVCVWVFCAICLDFFVVVVACVCIFMKSTFFRLKLFFLQYF